MLDMKMSDFRSEFQSPIAMMRPSMPSRPRFSLAYSALRL